MSKQYHKYGMGVVAGILATAGFLFNGNYTNTNAYSSTPNDQRKSIIRMLETPAYGNISENKNLEAKVMTSAIAPKISMPIEISTKAPETMDDDSIDYMKYVGLAKDYENKGKYEKAIDAYLKAAEKLESRDVKIVKYTDAKYSKDGKLMGKKIDEQMNCYLNVAKNYNQIKDYENALKYGKAAKMLDTTRYSNNQEINFEIEKARKGIDKSNDMRISMAK
jgi:tetratricopeptide (TPR) repeat protein